MMPTSLRYFSFLLVRKHCAMNMLRSIRAYQFIACIEIKAYTSVSFFDRFNLDGIVHERNKKNYNNDSKIKDNNSKLLKFYLTRFC